MSDTAPVVAPGGPAAEPERTPDAPAWRLVSSLALAGALAGLLLVVVYEWAQPRIQAHHAAALAAAIEEVLAGPARYERLFVAPGVGVVAELPAGVDSAAAERVWLGYDAAGAPIGFAVTAEKPGFQDVVRLIFGFDAATGEVIGMKVLDNKETPGLGDKIVKDSAFVGEFDGVATPLKGVKPGAGAGADDEVDMITGATISAKTVIDAINAKLELVGPALRAYPRGGP